MKLFHLRQINLIEQAIVLMRQVLISRLFALILKNKQKNNFNKTKRTKQTNKTHTLENYVDYIGIICFFYITEHLEFRATDDSRPQSSVSQRVGGGAGLHLSPVRASRDELSVPRGGPHRPEMPPDQRTRRLALLLHHAGTTVTGDVTNHVIRHEHPCHGKQILIQIVYYLLIF